MNIAFGMAAALFSRERTGQGSLVEISLLSSAMWTLSSDVVLTQALSDTELTRVASEGRYALTRAYETSDGRWVQLMFLDPERYWPELCRRIDREDLLQDPRFIDLDRRIEHGALLITELASAFKRKSFGEWRARFRGWDAPWELVQNIKELAADPQASANGYLFQVQVAGGRRDGGRGAGCLQRQCDSDPTAALARSGTAQRGYPSQHRREPGESAGIEEKAHSTMSRLRRWTIGHSVRRS